MSAATSKAMYGKPYTGHDYDGPIPEATAEATAEVAPVDPLLALATRSALLNAILGKVAEEAKQAKAELEDALREARRTRGTKGVDVHVADELAPEGQAVAATVGFTKDGKATVTVTHMDKCIEWVAQRKPAMIKEVVEPMYLTNLLNDLVIVDGAVVHPDDGETLDWVRPVPGAPGVMRMTFTGNQDGKDALISAWLAGQLNDVDVRALPTRPATEVTP